MGKAGDKGLATKNEALRTKNKKLIAALNAESQKTKHAQERASRFKKQAEAAIKNEAQHLARIEDRDNRIAELQHQIEPLENRVRRLVCDIEALEAAQAHAESAANEIREANRICRHSRTVDGDFTSQKEEAAA